MSLSTHKYRCCGELLRTTDGGNQKCDRCGRLYDRDGRPIGEMPGVDIDAIHRKRGGQR